MIKEKTENTEKENKDKKNNVNVNLEDLKNLLENAVNNTFDNRLEIINYKLDAIETQTTRTNGRVTDLEDKVDELEKDGIRRLTTCPQKETFDTIQKDINELNDNTVKKVDFGQIETDISELTEKTIKSGTIKSLVLKGITITGVFFTILFGLIFGILRVLTDVGFFGN